MLMPSCVRIIIILIANGILTFYYERFFLKDKGEFLITADFLNIFFKTSPYT